MDAFGIFQGLQRAQQFFQNLAATLLVDLTGSFVRLRFPLGTVGAIHSGVSEPAMANDPAPREC